MKRSGAFTSPLFISPAKKRWSSRRRRRRRNKVPHRCSFRMSTSAFESLERRPTVWKYVERKEGRKEGGRKKEEEAEESRRERNDGGGGERLEKGGMEETKGTLCSYMRLGRRCLRVFSPRFDQVEGASGMRDESTVTR